MIGDEIGTGVFQGADSRPISIEAGIGPICRAKLA